jgi:hypothetical protein
MAPGCYPAAPPPPPHGTPTTGAPYRGNAPDGRWSTFEQPREREKDGEKEAEGERAGEKEGACGDNRPVTP